MNFQKFEPEPVTVKSSTLPVRDGKAEAQAHPSASPISVCQAGQDALYATTQRGVLVFYYRGLVKASSAVASEQCAKNPVPPTRYEHPVTLVSPFFFTQRHDTYMYHSGT